MASAARERLAAMLGGKVSPAASSVQLKAKTDDLHLEVQGIGRVRLPVPAEQAHDALPRAGRHRVHGSAAAGDADRMAAGGLLPARRAIR
jgi:hypothetical protein